MAALDHPNYFRWDCIFLIDMKKLPTAVFEAFWKGYFTVKKENRVFSAIEIDQVHKQITKLLKLTAVQLEPLIMNEHYLNGHLQGHIYLIWFLRRLIETQLHITKILIYLKNNFDWNVHYWLAFQKFGVSFIVSPSKLINIPSKWIMFETGTKSVKPSCKFYEWKT